MRNKTYVEDTYDDDGNIVEPGYTTWLCDCGQPVYRYRGEGDVTCYNGHWFNASGQRLRDDWQQNPSWKYDDVDDCTGYEMQQLRQETDG